MRNSRSCSRGFTLIELMVTMVIAAILAAIAIPSYNSSVRKSRRTEARSAVLDAAAREERYYATNNKYTQTAADLGYAALPVAVGGAYYNLNVVCTPDAATCSGFSVTATPANSQTKDTTCASFIVDQTGKQTSTGPSAANTTATCWN
jgi:type IV pilus assembly protein PilE